MKKLILFLAFLPLLSFAGGPWVKQKGKLYTQLGVTTKSYSGRYVGTYAATFHTKLNRPVKENQAWIYGEYGIGKKMELGINLPFSNVSSSKVFTSDTSYFQNRLDAGAVNGFANSTVSIKRNFIDKKWLVTGQLSLMSNTSSRKENIGIQTGCNAWGFTPSVLFGKGKEKSFISGELGLRYLTRNYATASIFNFSYGGKITKSTWLIGEVNGVVSFENGKTVDGNFAQTALFVDNQGFVAYGLKIAQNINEHFALNLAGYSGFAVVNQGSNSGQFFFGVSYKID